MDTNDQGLTDKDLARARFIVARWNKSRHLKVDGDLRDTFDRIKFNDERAVIGMVESFACADRDSSAPYAMTIDGYRYLVFPEHDSTTIDNHTLIVQDVITGKELAYCPGQDAFLNADA